MSKENNWGSAENYTFLGGVGNHSYSNVLPPTALPKGRRTESWKKDLLDRLESIGLRQYQKNLRFHDYFKMVRGELVYADLLDDDVAILRDVNKIREEYDLPTYLRHYDFTGEIIHTIQGEWMQQKDKFTFDTVDNVSSNEFIREKTLQVQQYSQKAFQLELTKLLLQKGIDPDLQFENPQEQEQYVQYLQQEANNLIPPSIQQGMKNWKTMAAEWAEKTYDRDYRRFDMNLMELEECKYFLLTGRAPRHYLIGLDYYEPESWHPINTFHSEELNKKRFQDGEFVGRVMFYPVHQIIDRVGHKLTKNQIERLSSSFSGKYTAGIGNTSPNSTKKIVEQQGYEQKILPFKGADEYTLWTEFQDAMDIPMGELETAEGKKNVWLPPINEHNWVGNRLASYLTEQDSNRSDLIQSTEGYIKIYKKHGVLTYRTESGYLDVVEVDEDILKDFLKDQGIKEVNTISFDDALNDPKENTLVWTYIPVIHKFEKYNMSNTFFNEDLYFLEECPFQIKGRAGSNYYDKLLPVFGLIDTGVAEPMRTWQIQYNWVQNQNRNLLEKELGMFFLFDVTFLPTEFLNLSGDGEDIMTEMYNMIKDIGILPIDASKQNTSERGGTQFNSFMTQNVTFTPQIQRNIQLAQYYKQEALSQVGITPQRVGQANQYETAEGVKLGQNASFARTEHVFQKLLHDKQCKIEGHISVAQYCQLNNKDAGYLYRASDGELAFLNSIKDDKDFSTREFDIYPTMDSNQRKSFERLKETLLQRNTMSTTEEGLAKIMYSDDYLELIQIAQEITLRNDGIRQEQQASQERQTQEMISYETQKDDKLLKYQYDVLDNKIELERIEAIGRSSTNDSFIDPQAEINKQADIALNKEKLDNKKQYDDATLALKFRESSDRVKAQLEKLKIEQEKIRLKEKELETQRFTSIINKN